MFRIVAYALIGLFASTVEANDKAGPSEGALAPRGVVRPLNQATLAIDFTAPVKKIHFREGERFEAGDRLIEFDCRRQEAEFRSAEAQHREMQLTLKHNAYLRKRGAVGQHEFEVSRTRVAKAAADAEVLKLRLEQCQLNAPFEGSIVELGIHEHEIPTPGKPFLKIIQGSALEVELIVPSTWLVWLRVGDRFSFAVEETGKRYAASVTRVARSVDPISQTVQIFAVLDSAADVLAGMSGTAHFSRSGG